MRGAKWNKRDKETCWILLFQNMDFINIPEGAEHLSFSLSPFSFSLSFLLALATMLFI
jgi:hypothetical protein